MVPSACSRFVYLLGRLTVHPPTHRISWARVLPPKYSDVGRCAVIFWDKLRYLNGTLAASSGLRFTKTLHARKMKRTGEAKSQNRTVHFVYARLLVRHKKREGGGGSANRPSTKIQIIGPRCDLQTMQRLLSAQTHSSVIAISRSRHRPWHPRPRGSQQ